mmetsp:Transcript_61540/g.169153  ORF Transcript_61540/g.169153 Transcript_61540/m.169153 type:complete len:261 (+) Transcript_61540:369-1151(+)
MPLFSGRHESGLAIRVISLFVVDVDTAVDSRPHGMEGTVLRRLDQITARHGRCACRLQHRQNLLRRFPQLGSFGCPRLGSFFLSFGVGRIELIVIVPDFVLDGSMSVAPGNVSRRVAVTTLQVDVGPPLKQQRHHRLLPRPGSRHESRTIVILVVDVNAAPENGLHCIELAQTRRIKQITARHAWRACVLQHSHNLCIVQPPGHADWRFLFIHLLIRTSTKIPGRRRVDTCIPLKEQFHNSLVPVQNSVHECRFVVRVVI